MLLLLWVLRYCYFVFWLICRLFRVSRGLHNDQAKVTRTSISDQKALSCYSRPNRTHAEWGLSGTKQVKKLLNCRSFAYHLILLPLQSRSTINSSGLNSKDQSTTLLALTNSFIKFHETLFFCGANSFSRAQTLFDSRAKSFSFL